MSEFFFLTIFVLKFESICDDVTLQFINNIRYRCRRILYLPFRKIVTSYKDFSLYFNILLEFLFIFLQSLQIGFSFPFRVDLVLQPFFLSLSLFEPSHFYLFLTPNPPSNLNDRLIFLKTTLNELNFCVLF